MNTPDTSQSIIHTVKAPEKLLQSPNLVENIETSSVSSVDKTRSLPISNPEQNISKPLLNTSKIGSKRRNNIRASTEVEEIVSN